MDGPLPGPVAAAAHPPDRAPRASALLEALLPVALVQLWVWAVPRPRPRGADAVVALLVLGVVVALVRRSGPRGRDAFGLGPADVHRRALVPVAAITAGAVALLLVGGALTDTLRVRPALLRALLTYPLSGLAQQALVFGFVLPRLRTACGERLAPLGTALLFGLAHAPDPALMAASATLVLLFARVWRRTPSLPALALGHGIIGAVADKALDVSLRIGRGAL